jgi:hypothetical protein
MMIQGYSTKFNVILAKAGIHGLMVRPWTPDQVGGDKVFCNEAVQ